jgi:hypothetical protein
MAQRDAVAADLDGDGLKDLVVSDPGKSEFLMFKASAAGLAIPSLPYVKWGTFFLDYDNDGDQDLFVANGHVLDNAETFDSSTTYHQPKQLFANPTSIPRSTAANVAGRPATPTIAARTKSASELCTSSTKPSGPASTRVFGGQARRNSSVQLSSAIATVPT